MPRWTIDTPTSLNFDGVVALRVRLISGSVAVLAAGSADSTGTTGSADSAGSAAHGPSVDVAAVSGQPLLVTHEAGILTVSYEDISWEGLLGWLRPQRHSATVTITVPRDCPVQLGVVNASAVISGIAARTSIKGVSGEITLDGMTGDVDANTVSGDLEAQGLDGGIRFKTLSGDLTVADARIRQLDAKSVSGRVTADVDLAPAASLQAATVSGDVAIRLPASVGAQVDLRSASGRVDTAFDSLTSTPNPGPASVTGTLGAGDGRLSVSTVSGSVALLSRDPAGHADSSGTRPGTHDGRASATKTTVTEPGSGEGPEASDQ